MQLSPEVLRAQCDMSRSGLRVTVFLSTEPTRPSNNFISQDFIDWKKSSKYKPIFSIRWPRCLKRNFEEIPPEWFILPTLCLESVSPLFFARSKQASSNCSRPVLVVLVGEPFGRQIGPYKLIKSDELNISADLQVMGSEFRSEYDSFVNYTPKIVTLAPASFTPPSNALCPSS